MDIKQITENHALWLNTNGKEGIRADLDGANLARTNLDGANLDDANLEGVNGNLSHVKSIFCDTYTVVYTADSMQIGCQRHKLDEWWSFYDARIWDMDGKKALRWWRIWKPILQQIIAASPANATEYIEKND